MLRIQREGHTGVLRVRSENAETRISFRKGSAVFADGGNVSDTLGRMLLEEGVIDEDDYADAMYALKDGEDDMRLGHALLQLGKLTGVGVSEALGRQVRRKIGRPLSFRALTMAFNPLEDLPQGTAKFPTRIEPCVLSAVQRHFGARGAQHYIGGLSDSYLSLREPSRVVADRFEMNTHQARFLAGFTGAVRTARLVKNGSDEAEPSVVIAALVLAGAVSAKQAPQVEHNTEPPPNSVRVAPKVSRRSVKDLRGARDSDPGPISRTSRALRSQAPHSDRAPMSEPPASGRPSHISSMPPDEAPLSSNFPEARVSQVSLHNIEIPGPPSQRSPATTPPRKLGKVEAERAFQRGLRHMRAEQWPNAADEFGQAAAAMPDATEYQLYSAWASYRTCVIDEERSILRLELEDIARKMTKEDRNHGMPPYVLAHMALVSEENERALKLFQMAAKQDPKNRDAERHVRLLMTRLSDDKKKSRKLF